MTTTTLTLPTESDSIVLKTARLGRVQTPPELRERILDAFETSEMTRAAFAAHCGISYTTFANWRQRRRRAREAEPPELPPPPAPSPFVELCLPAPEAPAILTIPRTRNPHPSICDGASEVWLCVLAS